jgi:hypothetical protein
MVNGFQNELPGIEIAENALHDRHGQVDKLIIGVSKMPVSLEFGFGEDAGGGFGPLLSSLFKASAFFGFESFDRFGSDPLGFPLCGLEIAASRVPGLDVVSPNDATARTKAKVFAADGPLVVRFNCCRFHHQP